MKIANMAIYFGSAVFLSYVRILVSRILRLFSFNIFTRKSNKKYISGIKMSGMNVTQRFIPEFTFSHCFATDILTMLQWKYTQ